MAIKHTIRDKNGDKKEVSLTPLKAIIAHCRECMGHDKAEVAGCTCPHCALYPFRLGEAHSGKRARRSKN